MPGPTPLSPRASLGEWIQTALLGGNLVWTMLYMGGYRPVAQLVTLVFTAALLVTHALICCAQRDANASGQATPRRAHPAGWWLLPFLLYSAANVLWIAPARWLGWLDWLSWAQIAAVFWVTVNGIRSADTRRVLFSVLVALALAGVALGAYQRFLQPGWVLMDEPRAAQFIGRASGFFSIPNSLAGALLLLLPAALALAFRRHATELQRVWWGWVAGVMFCGIVLTLSRGAWLALLIVLAVWPLTLRRWAWRRRAAVALAVVAVLLAVGVSVYRMSPAMRDRLAVLVRDTGEVTRPVMWRAAWQLFTDAPWFGTGAGSYNLAFEKYRPEGFRDAPLWAHNEYLNTLSDYGVAGVVLAFGAVGVIAVQTGTRRRETYDATGDWIDSRALTTGLGWGLAAFALQLSVDFHLKIPALALLAATSGALIVQRRWTAPDASDARSSVGLARVGYLSVALGSVALVAVVLGPLLRSELLRAPARMALDRLGAEPVTTARYAAVVPAVIERLKRAVEVYPGNGDAWSDLAYARGLLPFVDPAQTALHGRAAEEAAATALALATLNPEFWIRRGTALNLQGRWVEAGDDFRRATELAPKRADAWFYYADHLARVPNAHEAAEAALAFCLRLDPWNAPAIALRQRLAIKSGPR